MHIVSSVLGSSDVSASTLYTLPKVASARLIRPALASQLPHEKESHIRGRLLVGLCKAGAS